MRILSKAHTPEGLLGVAKVQDTRGRQFQYSRRIPIRQWIDHPVSDANGYGDGYWRTAGKHDREAVEKYLASLGLIAGLLLCPNNKVTNAPTSAR